MRKLKLIFAVTFYVTAARANVRWTADFANDDLKQYGALDCGGQGGSCPCIAPLWQPANQVSYGSGSCGTSSTNTPLSVAPANGRFQIVAPPGQEPTGKALRVELRSGDMWPCVTCAYATTRNELVYTNDSGTSTPTYYQAGDDRYFAWSTYFPAEFARWTCVASDPNCPGGVPNANFNPWNVFTQFHHNGDNGVNPIGMDLRRTTTSNANSYALILLWGSNGGNNDRELWRQDLQAGNWYDFVLHVRFSTTTTGVLELWVGMNGGAKSKQTLSCPSGASQTCNVATLYSDGKDYLKQGLYRNASIADTSVIFHKGMMDGDTFADVTGGPIVPPDDFSIGATPATQTVMAGGTTTYTIQTAVASGNAQMVSLSASGLPADVTGATFDPSSVTAGGTSTLTLTTNAASAGVSGSLVITGAYANGLSHSTSAGITITPLPGVTRKVASLVDSFGGTQIDPTRWTIKYAVNGTATEGNGTLNLAPAARNGSVQITVDSNAQYDLTASSATVQVPQVVNQNCSVNNRFLLKSDGANSLGWWVECGNFYAFTFVNGQENLLKTLSWSSTSYKWWRVRESNGTVYWETSPDKTTWTTAVTAATSSLFPIGSLTVSFDSATWGNGLRSPGVGKYAHLNE